MKGKLDSDELEKCYQNMNSVRMLKREAYYPSGYAFLTYGVSSDIYLTNYFIFAFDSIDLWTIAHAMDAKHESEKMQPQSRIDMICILEKGVICNGANEMMQALPETESELVILENATTALLVFYILMSDILNQAIPSRLNLRKYLTNSKTNTP